MVHAGGKTISQEACSHVVKDVSSRHSVYMSVSVTLAFLLRLLLNKMESNWLLRNRIRHFIYNKALCATHSKAAHKRGTSLHSTASDLKARSSSPCHTRRYSLAVTTTSLE